MPVGIARPSSGRLPVVQRAVAVSASGRSASVSDRVASEKSQYQA